MLGTSPWSAVWQTLWSPLRTFTGLADRKVLWQGYLVQMILGLAALACAYPTTSRLAAEAAVKAGLAADQIPLAQMNAVISGALIALALPWILGTAEALLAKFMGLFTESQVPFRNYFGLMGYARIPSLIGSVIQGLLVGMAPRGSDVNSISLSMKVLAPTNAGQFTRAILTTIDPFELWHLVLLTMAIVALHRFSMKKALPTTGLVYLFMLGAAFLS